MLMGGVEDAVRGNPGAEKEARTAHHLMVGGFVCEIAGIGALGSGVALISAHPPGSSGSDAGVGLLLGSVAANVAALIVMVNAYPHAYDAVNIYNDGVDAASRARPPSTTVPVAPPPTQ